MAKARNEVVTCLNMMRGLLWRSSRWLKSPPAHTGAAVLAEVHGLAFRAQTASGQECDASSPLAFRFSAPGACEAVAFMYVRERTGKESPELSRRLAGQIYLALAAVVPERRVGGVLMRALPAFNDAPDTTHGMILDLIGAAVEHEAAGLNVIEERDERE